MRQAVEQRPANDGNPWLPEIKRDSAQRADRGPADQKTECDHEDAQKNSKRRASIEFAEVGPIFHCAAEEADLRESKAELVEEYAQC